MFTQTKLSFTKMLFSNYFLPVLQHLKQLKRIKRFQRYYIYLLKSWCRSSGVFINPPSRSTRGLWTFPLSVRLSFSNMFVSAPTLFEAKPNLNFELIETVCRGISQPFKVKVTLDGQTFEPALCVRSISHTLFEVFFY